jgi:hypothetical protein
MALSLPFFSVIEFSFLSHLSFSCCHSSNVNAKIPNMWLSAFHSREAYEELTPAFGHQSASGE